MAEIINSIYTEIYDKQHLKSLSYQNICEM